MVRGKKLALLPMNPKYREDRPDKKITFELSEDWKEIACGRHHNLLGAGSHINPANDEIYNPPEKKRFPKEGAWAMIVRKLPPIEKGVDRHVRVGRVFYLEHQAEADEFGFRPDGSYKAVATTPWGSVHLWPYEWSIMDPNLLFQLWDAKELIFHPLGNENMRWGDAVFYLRSRGIALVDAVVMALGTVKGPIGWFEPDPSLAEEMEAMEERVHRWKPRRNIRVEIETSRETGLLREGPDEAGSSGTRVQLPPGPPQS